MTEVRTRRVGKLPLNITKNCVPNAHVPLVSASIPLTCASIPLTVDQRFDSVDQRFNSLEKRLDNIERIQLFTFGAILAWPPLLIAVLKLLP